LKYALTKEIDICSCSSWQKNARW